MCFVMRRKRNYLVQQRTEINVAYIIRKEAGNRDLRGFDVMKYDTTTISIDRRFPAS